MSSEILNDGHDMLEDENFQDKNKNFEDENFKEEVKRLELEYLQDDGKPEKIEYHYGFYEAVKFCYEDFGDQMILLQEYELGDEPVRIDMLIINNGAVLTDSLGKFFKKYNVLEYKSPEDNLSIDDFYKVQGYACLYKSSGKTVNAIPVEDLTVSIFRHIYPMKLFKELERTGFKIECESPGIYYVTGKLCVPAQIVVTSHLTDAGYEALRIIAKNASKEDIIKFFEDAYNKRSANTGAVMRVSMAANEILFNQLREGNFPMGAFERIFHKELAEAEARGRVETLQLIKECLVNAGMSPEEFDKNTASLKIK